MRSACLEADRQCLLYGIHISQIYTYFSRVRWRSIPSTSLGIGRGTNSGSLPPSASAPLVHRLVVLWVFTLSTIHILIVIPSGYWYFVGGLRQPERWGQFYWLLSVQDGVVSVPTQLLQAFWMPSASSRRPWTPLRDVQLVWAADVLMCRSR